MKLKTSSTIRNYPATPTCTVSAKSDTDDVTQTVSILATGGKITIEWAEVPALIATLQALTGGAP